MANDTNGNLEKKVVKRRKISYQKVFSLVSAGFIIGCCIFYGTRFITLYLENRKEEIKLEDTLSQVVKENNNLKEINGDYYFQNDVDNNYLMYSNILWRIIKVNNDNTVKLISNDVLTYLSYGENDYENSYMNMWLNKTDDDNTGILENLLNTPNNYLTNDSICKDSISDTKHITCDEINDTDLIGTLSVFDYINSGGKDSYLNIDKYFYLSTLDKDNNIWLVNDSGNVSSADGSDIYGIRPTITLKSNSKSIAGDGTIDNPYVIDENYIFGSYVKLGEDIWRIYDIDGDNIKLSLNDYLKEDGEEILYKYSTNGYYHNDTIKGSLAYYLNNTYLNNLSYKNNIINNKWSNGIYGSSNDYDYKDTLNAKVDTKVTSLSVGDVILNGELSNYFLSTGVSKSSSLVYTVKGNGTLYGKSSTSTSKIVPTISIDKNILTKGNGTINSPYEME